MTQEKDLLVVLIQMREELRKSKENTIKAEQKSAALQEQVQLCMCNVNLFESSQ